MTMPFIDVNSDDEAEPIEPDAVPNTDDTPGDDSDIPTEGGEALGDVLPVESIPTDGGTDNGNSN